MPRMTGQYPHVEMDFVKSRRKAKAKRANPNKHVETAAEKAKRARIAASAEALPARDEFDAPDESGNR